MLELLETRAATAAEIERRKERIQRLEKNSTEQEMEIRKQLKLLRPGETTFILPEAPKAMESTSSSKLSILVSPEALLR